MDNDTLSGDGQMTQSLSEFDSHDSISCTELDKRQYQNDLELVRIELESKKLQIEAQKHEFVEKFDRLEELAENAERKARSYQTKFAELSATVAQAKPESQQRIYRTEIQEIVQRQKLLEATNRQLQAEAAMLEDGLSDLTVNEEEYGNISIKPKKQRSIKETAKIKLFETLQPLKSERDNLKAQIDILTNEFAAENQKAQEFKYNLDLEKTKYEELQVNYIQLEKDYEQARDLVARNHDKASSYDELRKELSVKETENCELTSQLKSVSEKSVHFEDKNKELFLKFESIKQREALLSEDKMYLKRQNTELSQRKSDLEKMNADLMDRNLRLQAAREDLVEKYLVGADKAKSLANEEQTNQIAILKSETDIELERIKKHLNELYSRESDALRCSRDKAEQERDNLQIDNKRLQTTIYEIQQDLSVIRAQRDAELSEINKRLSHAELDAKRNLLSRNEVERVLEQTQREAQASQRKNEVMQREILTLQNEKEKTKTNLKSDIRDLNRRLQAYEKIEQDLDSLVIQAADDDGGWELSGANIPTNAKRRMEQSARLAKRVINLEKINVDLTREIDSLKALNFKMKTELNSADEALGSVDQPYSYLVNNQREKDNEIQRLQETIQYQTKQIMKLEEHVDRLKEVKHQLTMDLEKVLFNQDIIRDMKGSLEDCIYKKEEPYVHSNQPDPFIFTKK